MPLRELYVYGKTAGARWMVGFASALWAASLFYPTPTFDVPAYKYMAAAMSEHAWAWAFSAHAVGLLIPLRQRMVRWAAVVAVHFYGLTLWGTVFVCLQASRGFSAAGSMSALVFAVACIGILFFMPSCPRGQQEKTDVVG